MPAQRLILMRHAKSDWRGDAESDFARHLNPRGRADAPRMARYLAQQNFLPDKIICSDAVRAHETLQCMRDAPGWRDIPVTLEHKLYLADVKDILRCVEAEFAESDVGTLMLLAHNPGMQMALVACCPEAADLPHDKLMPTAAAALIEWRPRRLVALQHPRALDDADK